MSLRFALYDDVTSPNYVSSYSSMRALVVGVRRRPALLDRGFLVEVFPDGDAVGTCLGLGEYRCVKGALQQIVASGLARELLPTIRRAAVRV